MDGHPQGFKLQKTKPIRGPLGVLGGPGGSGYRQRPAGVHPEHRMVWRRAQGSVAATKRCAVPSAAEQIRAPTGLPLTPQTPA